jgi:hypothetical protein
MPSRHVNGATMVRKGLLLRPVNSAQATPFPRQAPGGATWPPPAECSTEVLAGHVKTVPAACHGSFPFASAVVRCSPRPAGCEVDD